MTSILYIFSISSERLISSSQPAQIHSIREMLNKQGTGWREHTNMRWSTGDYMAFIAPATWSGITHLAETGYGKTFKKGWEK